MNIDINGKKIELEHRDSILDERGTLSIKKDSVDKTLEEFIEEGADVAHQIWSHWQTHLHGLCIDTTIIPPETANIQYQAKCFPAKFYDRWEKQIKTPYSELSEKEKESDREQSRKYKNLLIKAITTEYKSLREELEEMKIQERWHGSKLDRLANKRCDEIINNIDQKIINLESKIK
jgi:hypothetical protein